MLVQNCDFFTIDLQSAVLLQSSEDSACSFNREAKIIGYIAGLS